MPISEVDECFEQDSPLRRQTTGIPEQSPTHHHVTFFKLCTVPMFVFGLLSQILVYGAIGFLSPTLSLHLLSYQDFDVFWVGIFFGVPTILYILNTPLVSFYCKVISRRAVVLIGAGIFCLSVYMIGTSPIFSLPDSTKVIFMGLCLLGFSATMVVIPMFPEMLHSIEEALPHLKGDELNNVSAGFFNSCLGVGEALGPISASILTHALGFRSAEDILGTLILIYCVTYFLLNGKLKMFALKISSDKVKDDDFVPADANGIVEGSTGDRKVIRKNSDVDQIGLEPTQRLSASASGGLPRAFNLIQSLS